MSSLGSPVALFKAMLVRVPLILKTIVLHGARLSPVTGKQDLRTELTVAVIRSFLDFKALPIGKQQKGSMRDPGIKGPMWVSKVTLPQPEDTIQEAVFQAIQELKLGGETFDIPGVAPVEAEWTGYRSGVGKNAPLPDISESEKYEALKKEASSDMVILYFHGGAYFLMDPCTHRIPVAHLSKRTGARVLSVRYRLAPQHPFPSALVDALVAYLSLISPPPGSLHAPVPPNKIILSGDSAGGNLVLALLQTLLSLRRSSPTGTIRFHGQDIPIATPAGIAPISPWCDIMRSMPSNTHNAIFDYLPVPTQQSAPTYRAPVFPEDDIWPSKPPRVDFFVNANSITHPLVSPLSGKPDIWKNSPPVFISMGEEALSDEGLVLARKMREAGVPIAVEQFEGMPHCFGMIMVKTPTGKRFFDGLETFCRDAVAGTIKGPADGVTFVGFKLRETRQIPWDKVVAMSDGEVDERMARLARARVQGEKELYEEWVGRAKL